LRWRLGTISIRQGQLVLYFRAWVGRYNITTTEDIREAPIKVGQFSRTVVTTIAETSSTGLYSNSGAMVQRLARGPLKAEIRVRVPLALPLKQPSQTQKLSQHFNSASTGPKYSENQLVSVGSEK
jgi:hypothetical protein